MSCMNAGVLHTAPAADATSGLPTVEDVDAPPMRPVPDPISVKSTQRAGDVRMIAWTALSPVMSGRFCISMPLLVSKPVRFLLAAFLFGRAMSHHRRRFVLTDFLQDGCLRRAFCASRTIPHHGPDSATFPHFGAVIRNRKSFGFGRVTQKSLPVG